MHGVPQIPISWRSGVRWIARADGDFGDCTEMAVRKFQKEHALTVDGIAGKNTFAALDAAIGGDDVDAEYARIVGGKCYVGTRRTRTVRARHGAGGQRARLCGRNIGGRLAEDSVRGWRGLGFWKIRRTEEGELKRETFLLMSSG